MSDQFQGVRNQIVILGWSSRVLRIVVDIQQKIDRQGRDIPPIVIVTPEGSSVQKHALRRVYFLHGEPTDPETLNRAGVQHAQAVLIPSLHASAQGASDGDAVFAMLAVLSVNPALRICVELAGAETIHSLRHIRAKGVIGAQVEFASFQSVSEHLLAHVTTHGGVTKVLDRLLAANEQRGQLCVSTLPQDFRPQTFLNIATLGLKNNVVIIGYQRGGDISLNPENREQLLAAGDKIWFLGEHESQIDTWLMSA